MAPLEASNTQWFSWRSLLFLIRIEENCSWNTKSRGDSSLLSIFFNFCYKVRQIDVILVCQTIFLNNNNNLAYKHKQQVNLQPTSSTSQISPKKLSLPSNFSFSSLHPIYISHITIFLTIFLRKMINEQWKNNKLQNFRLEAKA
jgi:hypothetical protein